MLQVAIPQPRSLLGLSSRIAAKPTPSPSPVALKEPAEAASPLTDREHQILGLVAEGFSNKLIGCELFISERTVKNHLTNIMSKLQASDRTHAVVTALRRGWLSL